MFQDFTITIKSVYAKIDDKSKRQYCNEIMLMIRRI